MGKGQPDQMSAVGKKLIDGLQNDLRSISSEAKKKYPHLKEAAESGIVKLRAVANSPQVKEAQQQQQLHGGSSGTAAGGGCVLREALTLESAHLMEPFFMACDTKLPKLVQTSINAIQKFITFEAVNQEAATKLVSCLWNLMESGLEELKLLQTVTLLLSANAGSVRGPSLAKAVVLCFRLHFTRNPVTNNAASATIRQLVTFVFERVQAEDVEGPPPDSAVFELNMEELKSGSNQAPRSLRPAAQDAFLLFQDLIQLVNGDEPYWLVGLNEMTRTFGLELIESILTFFPDVFQNHVELKFLLKERVCQLVIRLFSPNLKTSSRGSGSNQIVSPSTSHPPPHGGHNLNVGSITAGSPPSPSSPYDRPNFPISIRLLRIVSVLAQKYYSMLVTESEIFLSLLVKFLELDKPMWQRVVALEVLHKMCSQPPLVRSYCLHYDMKPESTKIFRHIINAIAVFIQSQFLNGVTTHHHSSQSTVSSPTSSSSHLGQPQQQSGQHGSGHSPTNPSGPSSASQATGTGGVGAAGQPPPTMAFTYRGVWVPLVCNLSANVPFKIHYLECLDKTDAPPIMEGYGLCLALSCMIETVRCMSLIMNGTDLTVELSAAERISRIASQVDRDNLALHRALLESSWMGHLAAFSLLVDAATDEMMIDYLLRIMRNLVSLYGSHGLEGAKESFLTSLCKSSLPANYTLVLLSGNPFSRSRDGAGGSRSTSVSSSSTVPQPEAPQDGAMSNTTPSGGQVKHQRTISSDLAANFSTLSLDINTNQSGTSGGSSNQQTTQQSGDGMVFANNDSSEVRQVNIVAVGTPLPNTYLPANQHQSPVMLTSKNLQCMKCILHVALQDGCILKGSWHVILTTLQHLVWILGLRPTTGGGLKVVGGGRDFSPLAASGSSGSSVGGGSGGGSSGPIVTTAAMSDLPVLTTMMTRLFENSHYASAMLSRVFHSSKNLDESALRYLIGALIRLSAESMETALHNREPSLFAVAKLLETTIVNMHRIGLIWRDVTSHLIEVCQHPHVKMRDWGAEALTYSVRVALSPTTAAQQQVLGPEYAGGGPQPAPPTGWNESQSAAAAQRLMDASIVEFLTPLQELSSISYPDIRQKQLDCTLALVQSRGDNLSDGWPQILDIVAALTDKQSENLIRMAFQCLQLIVADYLQSIPPHWIALVIQCAARFGSQEQELNVSLTAVGLLWNVADYLYQADDRIRSALAPPDPVGGDEGVAGDVDRGPGGDPVDSLWMSLFIRLGDLCTDSRPAVRKSAGQTLFSTLGSHGEILNAATWETVIWRVLFPLLDRVRALSSSASTERLPDSKSVGLSLGTGTGPHEIFVHHSRNTAQKQWTETQILTLVGVAKIFVLKRDQLLIINDFHKAWSLLLDHVDWTAQSRNSEVSLSALKCLQDLLAAHVTAEWPETLRRDYSQLLSALPRIAWRVWGHIGLEATLPPEPLRVGDWPPEKCAHFEIAAHYVPTQPFLTLLMQLFPALYMRIKGGFSLDDIQALFSVMERCLSVPLSGSDIPATMVIQQPVISSNSGSSNHNHHSSSSIMAPMGSSSSEVDQTPMSPLQEAVMAACTLLHTETRSTSAATANQLLPPLFQILLKFTAYSCTTPLFGRARFPSLSTKFNPNEWVTVNHVPFGERAIRTVVALYQQTATHPAVIEAHVLHSIIRALKLPLSLRYACPSQTTWKLSVNSLLAVLQLGLPIARAHPAAFATIWADLALTLDAFLFSASNNSLKSPSSNAILIPQQLSAIDSMQPNGGSNGGSNASSSSNAPIPDESYDVRLIGLVRDSILPHAGSMPKEFVLQVVSLLNKGSIHSAAAAGSSPVDTECASHRLREEFARASFETLLQFSFLGSSKSGVGSTCPGLFMASELTPPDATVGIVNKLAVTSLLSRFTEVTVQYVTDERLAGKCPLPRHRMAEISFVLKALATLISSLKRAPPDTVERGVWDQLIGMYPHLVDCTISNSAQVSRSLREVLKEFADLLRPPTNSTTEPLSGSNAAPLEQKCQRANGNANVF